MPALQTVLPLLPPILRLARLFARGAISVKPPGDPLAISLLNSRSRASSAANEFSASASANASVVKFCGPLDCVVDGMADDTEAVSGSVVVLEPKKEKRRLALALALDSDCVLALRSMLPSMGEGRGELVAGG